MSTTKTGWERERRTHFDEIVANYQRVRPDFPRELFADIFAYIGENATKKALEIGAGTGKATVPFIEAGFDVTAVDISENMAAYLRERFGESQRFRVLVAAFEEASLPEREYDLIYAASAFHWIDAQIGCPKVFRLLKSGGAVALLRYNFNLVPADGESLREELQAIYEQHYYSHYKTAYRSVDITHELLLTPDKIRNGYGFEDLRTYGFEDVTMKLYDRVLTYSADAYIDHLDTLSDHRSLPQDNRTALYASIRELILEHGGQHSLNCVYQLYMGRKA